MIKGITVKNYLDEKMTIEMGNPQKTGIYIKDIDGLGLPSMSVQTDETVNYNISNYMSSSVSPRNLVFTFGITDDEYVETTRRKLYKYFIPQFPTQLEIVTDVIGSVSIVGYVESFDPDIFSNAETVQISLICPDPYFYTGGKITESSDNKTGLFNFTSWYEENTKKYANTPSVSKPVSLLEEKNGVGEHPIDLSYMSRVFNPRGFELEIYQDDNAFQKIVLDYLNGSITVNPGEIDPKLESNQFNNCSLLIKNSPEDQNVYKKDKATGNLTSLLDLCLIEGDFPNLVPGKNYFRVKIYGLYKNLNPYYDYLISDLYDDEPQNLTFTVKYVDQVYGPTSNSYYDLLIYDISTYNIFGNSDVLYNNDFMNRIRWGGKYESNTNPVYGGSYKKNTFYCKKMKLYKGNKDENGYMKFKYIGSMIVSNETCVVNHYTFAENKFTLESTREYEPTHEEVSVDIDGIQQVTKTAIPSVYRKSIKVGQYNYDGNVYSTGIGVFLYVLDEPIYTGNASHGIRYEYEDVDISSNNIFSVNSHKYGFYATVFENSHYKQLGGSSYLSRYNCRGDIPLTIRFEDLRISENDFFDLLFSEWGVPSLEHSPNDNANTTTGSLYGNMEYYVRVFSEDNEDSYDYDKKVLRESYDGKINISYDERYDAI